MVQFLLQAYLPSLNSALGIYIPLIVVNCIILGRAESYASKNNVWLSMMDGIGMGLGFTVGLTLIGMFRELLGAGTLFNFQIMPKAYEPITIFILAPGAFFVLAFLVAIINKSNNAKAKANGAKLTNCDAGCAGCASAGICGGHKIVAESVNEAKSEKSAAKAVAKKSADETDNKKDN